MQRSNVVARQAAIFRSHLLVALALLGSPLAASPQARGEQAPFARVNTWGAFAAYSNDSSHMLLGAAENRKLLNIGFAYDRKLLVNRYVNWQYSAELIPVALDSDPVQITTSTFTYTNPPLVLTETSSTPTLAACRDSSGSGTVPNGGPAYSFVATCGRRWTVGEAFSPVGFQWNFLTRRRLEPFLVGHGGYMYSSESIPVSQSGNFNFTFDLGGGVEWYRSRTQSIRLEYRLHHISNDWTAPANPGIDSGLIQVTYTMGR